MRRSAPRGPEPELSAGRRRQPLSAAESLAAASTPDGRPRAHLLQEPRHEALEAAFLGQLEYRLRHLLERQGRAGFVDVLGHEEEVSIRPDHSWMGA
jgi:hypothetical protein